MLIIFGWSTDAGSAEHTRSALEKLLAVMPFLRDMSPAQILSVDYAIRKMAHVTEYAILAVLAHRAIQQDKRFVMDGRLLLPVVIGAVYAATDEYHQSFVASRWPSFGDVLYDTFGGVLGTVASVWYRVRSSRRLL